MSHSRKILIAAATALTACVAAASPSQAAESAKSATTGKATVVCQLADPKLATPAILADPAAEVEYEVVPSPVKAVPRRASLANDTMGGPMYPSDAAPR